jgi:hypothetical protein
LSLIDVGGFADAGNFEADFESTKLLAANLQPRPIESLDQRHLPVACDSNPHSGRDPGDVLDAPQLA